MKLENPILVAEFGAAHGIKGEIRLKPLVDDPQALLTYGPLHAEDGRTFRLKSLRPQKSMQVAKVKGLQYRDEAERLTRLKLYVDRSALPDDTDEDEFYAADLVGCAAVNEAGETIGAVVAVPDFGAGDLLEIAEVDAAGKRSHRTWLLDFTRANVPEMDLGARRVTVVVPDEVSERDEAANENGDP